VATKCVLIVEDNFDNRVIYSDLLRHAGYEVLEAEEGRQGLGLARGRRPDVVLLDLSMPVMDGWETLRRLKEDPATAGIPVFALSAHVLFDGDFEHAREAGFAGYFTKPVEPRRILEELDAYFDRH
jgi:CheY-like chemotaxis protein